MVTIPRLAATALAATSETAPTASGPSATTVGAVGASAFPVTPEPALQRLLDLLPTNAVGAIDAADLRVVVTALWYKSGIGGELDQLGQIVKAPPGWTSERLEVGRYKVTHNLGTINYAVSVTPLNKTETVGMVPSIEETTETSFTYMTWHSGTEVLHDVWTQFVVAVNGG